MNVQARERVLTELDHVRLAMLSRRGSRARSPGCPEIDAVIDDARIVPSRTIAPYVVTMCSQVLLRFLDDGSRRKLTLCYPQDAVPESGLLSVLSPIGLGLLGHRVGDTVRWATPDGAERTAEVEALLFQPEASGDYTT